MGYTTELREIESFPEEWKENFRERHPDSMPVTLQNGYITYRCDIQGCETQHGVPFTLTVANPPPGQKKEQKIHLECLNQGALENWEIIYSDDGTATCICPGCLEAANRAREEKEELEELSGERLIEPPKIFVPGRD